MNREDFYLEVYKVVKEIPEGYVATYGQIAFLIGKPGCSRLVGQALSHTPDSLEIPCHRVVNFQGRLVPGWSDQRELLEKDGVAFKANGFVDLKKYIWKCI
ncbi:MAG: MGMT family protein [Solirubrobacterales bacterium]